MTWGYLALVALLYFAGSKIGFLMTFGPHPVSVLWPTNALLMSMLLFAPCGKWWLVLLAAFPAHLAVQLGSGVPTLMVLCWFVSNCTEALIGAAGIRFSTNHWLRFDSFRSVAAFIVSAAFLAPFVSSFLDAGFVTLVGWGGDSYWEVWRMRFFSNVIAVLSIVPVVVMGGTQFRNYLRRATRERIFEATTLAIGLVVTATLVFCEDKLSMSIFPACVYMPLPFLLWAAVRFGPIGVSSALLATALITIWGTAHGMRPFNLVNPSHNVLPLQIFLILMSVSLMLLSGALEERQNAARALDESENRFRAVADATPVMVWMSGSDKLCTFVNKAWLEFTGRSLESQLGNGWTAGVHPDDLTRCTGTYARAFDAREPFQMEYRLRDQGGKYGWVLDQGVPRYSEDGRFCGYIGTAIKITERKQTEEALSQSERRYREVVESQTEIVCRYLPDTMLTFVNEACCRFFMKHRDDLIGSSLLELIPPDQHATVHDHILLMAEYPKTVSFEHKLISADGLEHWHQWVVYPTFDDSGQVIEFQAIARDITDRRLAEESLRATHQQINELARRLIHAQEEERNRIARDLHDDFNQRLAAHAIALGNLRNEFSGEDDPLSKKLGKLEGDAVALSDEIRLIAHELHPPRIERTGLEATLRSFCDEFGTLTHSHIDLHVEAKDLLPVDVVSCCYRVVQEAVRNASKHGHATAIQVNVHVVDNRVVLLVADNGAGVDAEQLKVSHGLGMASMEERVKFLSGEFHVKRRERGGTLIAVELPIT